MQKISLAQHSSTWTLTWQNPLFTHRNISKRVLRKPLVRQPLVLTLQVPPAVKISSKISGSPVTLLASVGWCKVVGTSTISQSSSERYVRKQLNLYSVIGCWSKNVDADGRGSHPWLCLFTLLCCITFQFRRTSNKILAFRITVMI